MRPVQGKMADKRLGIEVASLRQSFWTSPRATVGLPHVDGQRQKRPHDWRDTAENFITPVIGAGDIKAAFDNAKVKTLIAALRARNTHRLISAMLVEMLSLQVQPSFEHLEFTSWVPWTKCIRQGGVESTLS